MHKMNVSSVNSPSYLWDNFLELQEAIRSNTVHSVYSLQGQVPNTIMTGDTTDISSLAEFGWYDWV